MPFRRQPAGPSPRLQALLEAAGRDRQAPASARRPASHQDRGWWEQVEAAPLAPPARAPANVGRHRRPRAPLPALLMLPQCLRGARLTGPRSAIVGLLLVVVLGAAFFGVRIAWARTASEPHVVAPGRPGAATAAPGGTAVSRAHETGTRFASSPTASGGGGPPGAPGTVTVDIVGRVRRAGVVRLPAGSRVADAVAAAGGVSAGADPSAINLARVLVDGEQIRVPKTGEALATLSAGGGPAGGSSSVGSASGGPASGGSAGTGGIPSAAVNLNTASLSELDALPGVGPVLAQRILDWRAEHRRFDSVDQLAEVGGIGDKIFAQLRSRVTV